MSFLDRVLPHDFRGWVGFGLFIQSSSLFGLMALFRSLMDNQGFMTLASAVVVTGWVGGVAAFAYSAGKRDGENTALANRALDLATASAAVQDVNVVNPPSDPVQTTEAP